MTWWLGDVGGLLLVTPFIVLWGRSRPIDRTEALELAKLLLGTVAVGLIAFSPTVQQTSARSALAFLAIAPMLWAALRYQQRDTATAALVLSCFAIWGTLANSGPFVRSSLNDSFLLVLTFVISAAIPSLVLSADVAVRRRGWQPEGSHAEVRSRIEARTSELAQANRAGSRAATRRWGARPRDIHAG
jgi:integral membrane sensor domain MASE1